MRKKSKKKEVLPSTQVAIQLDHSVLEQFLNHVSLKSVEEFPSFFESVTVNAANDSLEENVKAFAESLYRTGMALFHVVDLGKRSLPPQLAEQIHNHVLSRLVNDLEPSLLDDSMKFGFQMNAVFQPQHAEKVVH